MNYVQDVAKDIAIAYIGGGSKDWAWKLMSDLADEEKMSGTVCLYDIDFESACNNEIIGNSLYDRADVKGKWRYKAVKTIEEALIGADFVIISIMPGPLKAMEVDIHVPEKYGIYQSVGDTVGPGGFFRALRTIPIYIEFAKKIEKYCNLAWVINYTNPMTICTRILYTVFPGIKAFGCCHEVFSSQMLLADVLYEMKGIKNIPREKIKVKVMGINHFTWIEKASYGGIDILPLYKEFVDRYFDEGYVDTRQKIRDPEEALYFGCANRVKFDLFRRYGLMAAAGDRHLAEFVPCWYLRNPAEVAAWKFALTPISYRYKVQEERNAKSRKLAAGEEKFELKKTGEEGVNQMEALLGFADLVTNVNLPNRGQLEGFPENAVVETNALFSKNGVQPILAGKFSDDIKNLIIRHVINQETILTAAINKDKKLAFDAFINDPLVNIPLRDAKALFKEMFDHTKEYLPGWEI